MANFSYITDKSQSDDVKIQPVYKEVPARSYYQNSIFDNNYDS